MFLNIVPLVISAPKPCACENAYPERREPLLDRLVAAVRGNCGLKMQELVNDGSVTI